MADLALRYCDPRLLDETGIEMLAESLRAIRCHCGFSECIHRQAVQALGGAPVSPLALALAFLSAELDRGACWHPGQDNVVGAFRGPLVGQYQTILADPPWEERGGGQRGANYHYDLMSTEEICAMPVRSLAHPDGCHLYLWVTNNFLVDGLKVMKAWGFRYVTIITWKKNRLGLGQYFQGQTEHCLFGVRGNLPLKTDAEGNRLRGSTFLRAPRRRHSEKPGNVHRIAERVSYEPRIEMFARARRQGWSAAGNQVPGGPDAIYTVAGQRPAPVQLALQGSLF